MNTGVHATHSTKEQKCTALLNKEPKLYTKCFKKKEDLLTHSDHYLFEYLQ